MSSIESLLQEYSRFVAIPWDRSLAGPQKVWFIVYDPRQERRLRRRVEEFAIATRNARHGWVHVDLTDTFAHWMASHDYRDEYFRQPQFLEPALRGYRDHVVDIVREHATAPEVDEDTVVAISGIGSLFGLAKTSSVVEAVAPHIRGRLVVFFPGQYENSNYRLLDARDGWNYLAVPITATNGG